ncbi:MAG: hypothetical protein AAGD22_05080 [Verrucomicrobiota bacterium]
MGKRDTMLFRPSGMFLFLSATCVWASPVKEPILDEEQLAEIGVKMEHHLSPAGDEGAKSRVFEISWQPKIHERHAPSFIWLQFWSPGEDHDFGDLRHWVRFNVDADGKCEAEFSISEEELDTVILVFRESWKTEYCLRLSDLFDGFSSEVDHDPFVESE